MARFKLIKSEGRRSKGKGEHTARQNPEVSYVLFGSHPGLLRLPVRASDAF